MNKVFSYIKNNFIEVIETVFLLFITLIPIVLFKWSEVDKGIQEFEIISPVYFTLCSIILALGITYIVIESKRNGYKPNIWLLTILFVLFVSNAFVILSTPLTKTYSFIGSDSTPLSFVYDIQDFQGQSQNQSQNQSL